MLNITCKLSNQILSYLLTGTIDFCHFSLHLVTLSWLEVIRLAQSKTCWLHSLLHFSTKWDEILYGDEAVLADHHQTGFDRDLYSQVKNFNVGMRSDVSELMWFKHA